MFARLSRSWGLVKASASVLRQDKELLLFPLMSAGAMVLLLAAFAAPIIGLGALDGIPKDPDALTAMHYAVAFAFYFCQYFVIFFFNSALVGAALIRLEGRDPTFGDGMRIATSKLGAIAGYAAIAATVGMILRIIQERVGFIGKIIVGLLGVGWTLATFLVVPVLVHREVGPVDAVKESALLLKKTWGENVIGQVGLGVAFAFIYMAVVLSGIVLIVLAAASGSGYLIALAFVALLLAIGVTALVQSALAGIYAAALYRYATTGTGSQAFQAESMRLAFAPKK